MHGAAERDVLLDERSHLGEQRGGRGLTLLLGVAPHHVVERWLLNPPRLYLLMIVAFGRLSQVVAEGVDFSFLCTQHFVRRLRHVNLAEKRALQVIETEPRLR